MVSVLILIAGAKRYCLLQVIEFTMHYTASLRCERQSCPCVVILSTSVFTSIEKQEGRTFSLQVSMSFPYHSTT